MDLFVDQKIVLLLKKRKFNIYFACATKSVLTFLWLVYKRLRNWKGVEFSLIRKEMPVTTHYLLRCAIFVSFLKYVLFCRNSQMRPSLWIVGRTCVHAPGFGFPLIKNCSLYRVYILVITVSLSFISGHLKPSVQKMPSVGSFHYILSHLLVWRTGRENGHVARGEYDFQVAG